jgi:hypothetical protein
MPLIAQTKIILEVLHIGVWKRIVMVVGDNPQR